MIAVTGNDDTYMYCASGPAMARARSLLHVQLLLPVGGRRGCGGRAAVGVTWGGAQHGEA
jgi:hypothetical protein